MITSRASIVVSAPARRIFDVLTDPSSWAALNPSCLWARPDSRLENEGQRVEQRIEQDEVQTSIAWTVQAIEQDRLLALVSDNPRAIIINTIAAEAPSSAVLTRVVFCLGADSGFGVGPDGQDHSLPVIKGYAEAGSSG